MLSSFSIVYQIESNEVEKGEAKMNLSYRFYLKNQGPLNLSSISLRLALLKSWGNYQIVDDIKIRLQPNRTTTDEYTNEFAWYEYDNFLVNQTLDVVIDANITVKFMDYSTYDFGNIVYDEDAYLYKLYTAYDALVDTTDPRIQSVANKFTSDTSDFTSLAFEAYNFSSTYLDYKLLSESKGASFAISNGYGDCDEYQNLFIALARAVGIPSIGHSAWFGDFQTGYVSTDAGAIAHAYPMFYIPEVGLISADPTRGKDALYDNWMKTDGKRITMTQGPDHPYRLLNYKWVPVDGFDNPTVESNYTIKINDMTTEYFSKIRSIILYQLVILPVVFISYNIIMGKRIKKEKELKVKKLLDPKNSVVQMEID